MHKIDFDICNYQHSEGNQVFSWTRCYSYCIKGGEINKPDIITRCDILVAVGPFWLFDPSAFNKHPVVLIFLIVFNKSKVLGITERAWIIVEKETIRENNLLQFCQTRKCFSKIRKKRRADCRGLSSDVCPTNLCQHYSPQISIYFLSTFHPFFSPWQLRSDNTGELIRPCCICLQLLHFFIQFPKSSFFFFWNIY